MYTRNSMPRRILAMVLAIAMVLSNVSVAFSDTASNSVTLTPRDASTTTDLSTIVSSVTIKVDGKEVTPGEDGKYSVNPQDSYSISLKFAESSSGTQFNNTSFPWTYKVPDGFDLSNWTSQSITATVSTSSTESFPVYFVATYNSATGNIEINKSDNNPNWDKWTDSDNTYLTLEISGKFNKDAGSVTWGTNTSTELDVETVTPKLEASKYAEYDADTNRIKYTVTVTSTGDNTNVVVNDTLTGSAVSFDPSSFTVTSDPANAGTLSNVTATGFTYTIGSMSHKDVVKLTYYANLDTTALTKSEQK